jgi:hypothetical protein
MTSDYYIRPYKYTEHLQCPFESIIRDLIRSICSNVLHVTPVGKTHKAS